MVMDTTKSKAAKRFILLTVFIYAAGFGIIVPVLPKLVMELEGITHSQATAWGAWIGATYSICMFLCGPLMGNLSDRLGRRPVFLFSLFAFGIDFLLMGLAPNILWLFIGRGIAGGLGAIFGPANAAMADLSDEKDRAASFGKVGAAFGIGFIIGPAIGGILGDYGTRIPFFVAGGLALANTVYGLFVFPETMADESKRAFSLKRANPLGALINMGKVPAILPIVLVYFLWQWASQIYAASWAYFTPVAYGWDTKTTGLSLTITGISMVVIQARLLSPAVAKYGERKVAVFSITFGIVGYLLTASISHSGFILALCLLMGVQGMAMPALNAMMSRRTPVEQQGELQGLNSSMSALSLLFAQLLYNNQLSYFSGPNAPFHFPGSIFITSACIGIITLLLLLRLPKAEPVQDAQG